MALEIKILDYGDIELESSFLVLGRDCGRTRRVPTFGFLILGGTWPVVVDTGYRSNQIMETLGMRGLQFHENMIENQLARHGVRMGDVRYVLHTHLHIDHAGKDDLFPMNTTVGVNRRELEYSVSGLMHPQYPLPDIKHLIDRLHTKNALRFFDLEISGPIELIPGVRLEAAGAHTEGSMNVHVETADGLATLMACKSGLGLGFSPAFQDSGVQNQPAASRLRFHRMLFDGGAGNQLGLVEATLAQLACVQRHRNHHHRCPGPAGIQPARRFRQHAAQDRGGRPHLFIFQQVDEFAQPAVVTAIGHRSGERRLQAPA